MKPKSTTVPYYLLVIANQYGQLQFNMNHQSYPNIRIDELLGLTSLFYVVDNLQSTIVPEKVLAQYTPSQIDFLNKNHIQEIETSTFRLTVFQTVTGFRFMLLTEPESPFRKNMDTLRQIYKLFTDYALKDPFFTSDSPIQNKMFKTEVLKVLQKK